MRYPFVKNTLAWLSPLEPIPYINSVVSPDIFMLAFLPYHYHYVQGREYHFYLLDVLHIVNIQVLFLVSQEIIYFFGISWRRMIS